MARATGSQRRAKQTTKVQKVKTKKVRHKRTGKVITVYSYDGGKTWSKNKSQAGGTRKWTNPEKGPTQPKIYSKAEDDAAIAAGKEERGNPGVKGGDADYGQGKGGKVVGQSSPSTQLKIKKNTKEGNTESSGSSSSTNKKKRYTMRERMADKNRKIFGKNQAGEDIFTKLQQKHKEWKKARKEGKLDEWRKKWKNGVK